jgi:hypothetical protein
MSSAQIPVPEWGAEVSKKSKDNMEIIKKTGNNVEIMGTIMVMIMTMIESEEPLCRFEAEEVVGRSPY